MNVSYFALEAMENNPGLKLHHFDPLTDQLRDTLDKELIERGKPDMPDAYYEFVPSTPDGTVLQLDGVRATIDDDEKVDEQRAVFTLIAGEVTRVALVAETEAGELPRIYQTSFDVGVINRLTEMAMARRFIVN